MVFNFPKSLKNVEKLQSLILIIIVKFAKKDTICMVKNIIFKGSLI